MAIGLRGKVYMLHVVTLLESWFREPINSYLAQKSLLHRYLPAFRSSCQFMRRSLDKACYLQYEGGTTQEAGSQTVQLESS